MGIISVVGILASVFTACSMLPQLTKVIKEKAAESISLGMLAILLTGLALWVYYGILKDDLILIISNSFSIIINLLLGFFTLKYKKEGNV